MSKLAVGALLCALITAGWFWRWISNDRYDDWWFDQTIWKAQRGSSDSDNPRGKMGYDLEHRVLKPGMTRQQVLQILGPPDDGPGGESISYSFGTHGFLALDMDVFTIEFDKRGKAKKFYRFTD